MARDQFENKIEEAARSFDAELHTRAFAETHSDAAQLAKMLSFLSPEHGQRILDLGTGNGYVAKSIAGAVPDCRVIGIDVARRAIETNIDQAEAAGLSNLDFLAYDGTTLPFPDNHFDAAVSRYVLHHLPQPETSLAELGRTIRRNGRLVLADGIRHEADDVDFINRFQEVKRDGHIRMYHREEFIDLVGRSGFRMLETVDSSLIFTRERGEAYDALLAETPEAVLRAYSTRVGTRHMTLTLPILSVVFENTSKS